MKIESRQRLRKIFKEIFRIYGVLFFVSGLGFLAYLHWDTYWYGLKLMLLGLLYWNLDKLWSPVEQEGYQDNK
jgi:hypothetical protein